MSFQERRGGRQVRTPLDNEETMDCQVIKFQEEETELLSSLGAVFT